MDRKLRNAGAFFHSRTRETRAVEKNCVEHGSSKCQPAIAKSAIAVLTSKLAMNGCPIRSLNTHPGELCCGGLMMRPAWPNGTPSPGTGMCNATNLVCDGTHCVMCGTSGALCCSGGVCFTGGDVCDGTGHCISTGGGGTGGGGGGLPGDMF